MNRETKNRKGTGAESCDCVRRLARSAWQKTQKPAITLVKRSQAAEGRRAPERAGIIRVLVHMHA